MDTVAGQASSAAGEINIGPKAADDDLVDHIGTPSQHHHDYRGRLTEGIQFKHYHSVRVLGATLHSLPWLSMTFILKVTAHEQKDVHVKRYLAIHFHFMCNSA